jgi:archaemetzincin
MVPKDAYCMLVVTMKDLYPFDSWNYVFGWANYKSRIGVFSFGRYNPDFNGMDSDNNERDLLENSCYVMVHEIGHMYGLTHCTFY